MKFVIFIYAFSVTLFIVNACETSRYLKPTSTEHGSPVAGPIYQKLTNCLFKYQNGLHYDSESEVLHFVDRHNATISKYNPFTGELRTCYLKEFENQGVSLIVPVANSVTDFVLAGNQSLYLFSHHNDTYEIKEIVKVLDNTNEVLSQGTVDANGALLITSKPANPDMPGGTSKLYRVDFMKNNTITIVDGDGNMTHAIDVALCKYNINMYVSDPVRNVIFKYHYNPQTGLASDRTITFNMEDHKDKFTGNVSGVTVDKTGNVWISFTNARILVYFDPHSEKIQNLVGISLTNTRSIEFGGDDVSTLYLGNKASEVKNREPYAGALYGLTGLPFKGYKSYRIVM